MEWIYICLLVAFVIVMFTIVKRPMYEIIFMAFVLMCLITGKITSIGTYLVNAADTYLLFSITVFMAFSLILEETGAISDMIDIIISVVGRFSGGAGYVALVASAAMGALCGSAPGNAAAIGVIAIPSMKKTGFSPELAATVEMAASALGPVIPPSGAIVILYSILESLYPGQYSFSQFWLLAWVISFWYLLHRFVTLFFLIRKHKVAPIPKEDRPPLHLALKRGWRSLFLPIIIFVPFLLDALCKETLITNRLGAVAAASFTNILLIIVPSIATVFALHLYVKAGNKISVKKYFHLFKGKASNIAPIIVMAYAGFALTELFTDAGIADGMGASIASIDFPLWFVAIVVPLVFTFLGMFMEPTSLIMIFGSIFITLATSVGIHPMLGAMLVNVMTCALAPMTPPFALCLFVCIGIAESDFKKTSLLSVVWCVGHYLLAVLMLFGLIPMFGTLV